jgi:acetyl esterase/lipase
MPEDESILTRGARAPDGLVAYGEQPGQDMEVWAGRSGRRPVVIVLHGGFWRPDIDRVHARPMCEALSAAGWTVALPEYARVAGNPEPTLRDIALILSAAASRVAAHDGRVVALGHSAGGHLALWATAARLCPALTGTLALAPVADLLLAHELGLGNGAVRRFLGGEPVSRPDIDPRQMAGPATPTTLVHGLEDAIVPAVVSESYATAHPQARLRLIAAAGHFALIDPASGAWASVLAELQALCR